MLTEPTMPKMSTQELLERLRRHYIKPGPMAGGVFVPEVSFNGQFGAGRRCDALYDTLVTQDFNRKVNEATLKARAELEKDYQERKVSTVDEFIRTIAAKVRHMPRAEDIDAIVEAINDRGQVEQATRQARRDLRDLIRDANRLLEPWKSTYGALASELAALAEDPNQ